jgi:hypothetical protein
MRSLTTILPKVTPYALNADNFRKVITVVDASIATSTKLLALHSFTPRDTIFVSGANLVGYLRKLETAETKLHEIDFAAPADEASAASTAAPAKKAQAEKEDAKIEGAVQVAIGVKKEVDFAAWYTTVRSTSTVVKDGGWKRVAGSHQSGHARLLQCQWMLHSQAVVILHLGVYSRCA